VDAVHKGLSISIIEGATRTRAQSTNLCR